MDKLKLILALVWAQISKAIPKNWQQYIGYFLVFGATWAAAKLGYDVPTPMPPIPIWEPGADDMGWVPDPDAVKEVQDQLDFPSFKQTPAGQADDPLPKSVYLWHAEKKILGSVLMKNQLSVGSCVSFGTNNAIRRTMAVQIAINKLPEELKDICEEVTYAGSRVEIGGGRLRGDGSVGAWAAKFVKDYGVVAREVHGKHDLTKYDPARCRSWGSKGVPDDLEPIARQHPVKDITLVQTWAEAKKALASGYGIAICSNQGFSMSRDSRGVSQARGSWAHCMCLDGYHTDEDGKEYGHITNSWGDKAHTGPVGWGDPGTDGFWAEARVVEGMLRQKDSWAFSSVKGFPARQIDWFVKADGKSENRTLYARLFNPVPERSTETADAPHLRLLGPLPGLSSASRGRSRLESESQGFALSGESQAGPR